MWKDKTYLPVLCFLDKRYKDIGNHKYPSHGFVSAKDFVPDRNIETGLYGIAWGITDILYYERTEKNYWALVKTEITNDIIIIDGFKNRVKFRNGIVLLRSTLEEIVSFLLKSMKKPQFRFEPYYTTFSKKDVIGTRAWKKEDKNIYFEKCNNRKKICI